MKDLFRVIVFIMLSLSISCDEFDIPLKKIDGINQSYSISLVSGDQQEGVVNTELSEPIIILVKDALGKVSEGNYININNSRYNNPSDSEGLIYYDWTLGPKDTLQTLKIDFAENETDSCENNCNLNVNATAFLPCPEFFVDERDLQVYPAKRFGKDCWMAKNLNFGAFINYHPDSVNQQDGQDNLTEKYCLNNDPDNCDIIGAFYSWEEAVEIGEFGNQGVCPDGWHLPTVEEWNRFYTLNGIDMSEINNEQDNWLGGCESIEPLKSIHWAKGTMEETLRDECDRFLPDRGSSGFQALATGILRNENKWQNLSNTYWWSSEEISASVSVAYAFALYNITNTEKVFTGPLTRSYKLSVRCIKDR